MSERSYNHARVQEYWQYVWEQEDAYGLPAEATDPTYVLGMFPYTSGTLHMGHVRNYAITDAYARYRRMAGDDVLHPMGWDAFGLPAENAAYERYTDPKSWTDACIQQMREEMKTLGFGYDWSREVTTCHPSYYRWNQYFFREFYEAGLVEYRGAQVNWCPDCETVLADAQVDQIPSSSEDANGDLNVCWRCETPVGQRELDQWFFTITDYADELLDGLDELTEWPESVRGIQRNWIGRREGASVTFDLPEYGSVDVFTTRLDTIAGATYLAVSPGHDLARRLAESDDSVASYLESTVSSGSSSTTDAGDRNASRGGEPESQSSAGDRPESQSSSADQPESHSSAEGEPESQPHSATQPGGRPYSGVKTAVQATHPLSGERIPVYVASYVLADVGTGAIMGVPAHNERDHRFAREHDLPVEVVVEPVDGTTLDVSTEPFTEEGMLVRSGEYDGLASSAARERLLANLDEASADVTYRLRDWLISRQRYWGTPIPIVHCDDCGPVLVPESDLPVELPEFVQTKGNPLDAADSFVQTSCPDCGGSANRETDTMDTFVDSSWYFLRYLDPTNDRAPFDPERANEWLPVDVYVGGEEHAILHLLYIRFFTRALADLGLLDIREPVEKLINQGTVLHSGVKMSKTRGNVISPHEYGAETTRLFVLSAAHPEQDFEWTARDVGASYDLQQQLFAIADEAVDATFRSERKTHDGYVDREIDRAIAAVTEQYEAFRFHRVVAEIRGLLGLLGQYRAFDTPQEEVYRRGLLVLTRLIAPMTPYLAEEMWNRLRGEGIVAHAEWPTATHDVDAYAIERRVVETLRNDVRDIFEVASITDASEVEIVVTPEWKYRAYELARSADENEAVVGRIMADDSIAAIGELAREYATDLQERQRHLPPVLDPEAEYDLLSRAAWLLTDEFGTAVTVHPGSEASEALARKARPGKPAIHIE